MTPKAAQTRWTPFVADCEGTTTRILHEQGNPAHRLRVGHNRETLLVHLTTRTATVDRSRDRSRNSTLGCLPGGRQLDAAEDAYARLCSKVSNS